jgi:hypothetical protein
MAYLAYNLIFLSSKLLFFLMSLSQSGQKVYNAGYGTNNHWHPFGGLDSVTTLYWARNGSERWKPFT